MSIVSKERHDRLLSALRNRYENLVYALEPRELSSVYEGCAKGEQWLHPEKMCATRSDEVTIRLFVDDLKTILVEIRKV